MVETAWHYRHRASVGKLSKRRKGQPAAVIALADKAQTRLSRRFRKLNARGLPAGKVVVAVAREVTGFVWAAMQPVVEACRCCRGTRAGLNVERSISWSTFSCLAKSIEMSPRLRGRMGSRLL